MKKHLMIFVVALVAVAVAMPALAAVEFKYGGQFRARWYIQDNVYDGTDKPFSSGYNSDDNRNIIDQRLRLYFTFAASKNLQVVTKFEVGDSIWGQGGNAVGSTSQANIGHNIGANVGGDSIAVEVKNAYMQFNIPNTPSTAVIGLQSITLLDSWIVDDDLPAAVLVTKFDPFKVTLAYVGGQNGWEKSLDTSKVATTDQTFNVSSYVAALDYANGPFKASLVGFVQDGYDSVISLDPRSLFTPIRNFSGGPDANGFDFLNDLRTPQNNLLADIGVNLTYKVDWLMAYVNFVKNLGSVDLKDSTNNPFIGNKTVDYTGWMIDAGVTYYCGPYTANIGGFYTTGPKIADNIVDYTNVFNASGVAKPFRNLESTDVDWFVTPAATGKQFSEIIGGGILGEDLHTARGYSSAVTGSKIGQASGLHTVFWRGYYNPTNLWTVTAGGSWQVAEKTKISASYWYFGTSEEVPVALILAGADAGKFQMSSSIGHEFDVYIDQGIVDGLTLTLVGAYLFANDAFAPIPADANFTNVGVNAAGTATKKLAEDAFELGARLQWSF